MNNMCKDKAEEKKEQFLEMFSPEDKDKVSEFYDDLIKLTIMRNFHFCIMRMF